MNFELTEYDTKLPTNSTGTLFKRSKDDSHFISQFINQRLYTEGKIDNKRIINIPREIMRRQ